MILLALLGFQLPKLLGKSKNVPDPSPTETTVSAVPGVPGLAPGQLPDTDRVTIEPTSGQLLSFGLFKSKDPFVQQLSTVPTGLTSLARCVRPAGDDRGDPVRDDHNAGVAHAAAQTAPSGGLTPVTTPRSTPPPRSCRRPRRWSVTSTPAGTTPRHDPRDDDTLDNDTGGARDGAHVGRDLDERRLRDGGRERDLPGTEDIFRVVSIAQDGKSVKIGVVGGAYDSGQATATLKLGEKLTLVNTADGTRYVIVLKAKCDVVS